MGKLRLSKESRPANVMVLASRQHRKLDVTYSYFL